MMKYIAILQLILLASCTQPDSTDDAIDAGLSTLQANNLQLAETNGTAATRATTYSTTGTVGFYVKGDSYYKALLNSPGTYATVNGTAAWRPATDVYLNSHAATVAIYAPYSAAQDNGKNGKLQLTAGLRKDAGNNVRDLWCYRSTSVTKTATINSVTLNQLYARFTVTLTRDANYKADATITNLKVEGSNIYPTADYNVLDGTYTLPFNSPINASAQYQLDDTNPTATYDLLMIPATVNSYFTYTFTIDGKPAKCLPMNIGAFGGQLTAGTNYTVPITLKAGELVAGKVTIEDWSDNWNNSTDMDWK